MLLNIGYLGVYYIGIYSQPLSKRPVSVLCKEVSTCGTDVEPLVWACHGVGESIIQSAFLIKVDAS